MERPLEEQTTFAPLHDDGRDYDRDYIIQERIERRMWYEIRSEPYKYVHNWIADPAELLSQIFQIVAKAEQDWDERRLNGMLHTRTEHRAFCYTEIRELVNKLVEQKAEFDRTNGETE